VPLDRQLGSSRLFGQRIRPLCNFWVRCAARGCGLSIGRLARSAKGIRTAAVLSRLHQVVLCWIFNK
jgi:hypothetical protein